MNIHEYQAKDVFRRFGIPVLKGGVAHSSEEAQQVADGLETPVVVVKSQIHAGGRGKGRFKEHGPDGIGGVVVVKDKATVAKVALQMLDSTLVTKQTGPGGQKVRKLFVESGCDIDKEFYAAVTLDRATRTPTLMVSPEGGMDIEEVAEATPEKIFTAGADPLQSRLFDHDARRMAKALGLTGKSLKQCSALLKKLVECFYATDASMVEVNPLVLTKGGDVLALDAKMNFDHNGLPRQPEIVPLRDPYEETEEEREAKHNNLSYISLSGNIGCMVNGAGLAMATMDMIKHAGGTPANFLDVGGNATEERITAAFRIIVSDPDVKAILVNIFGGILLCDLLATGVVAAARTLELKVPLVVRMEGTNVERGREILANSGLPIQFAEGLAVAAEKAVAAAGGAQ